VTVEASAGGGMVTVKMNGQKQIVDVRIEPDVFAGKDQEMLQDLVRAAVNEASRRVDEELANQMKNLSGGIPASGTSRSPAFSKASVFNPRFLEYFPYIFWPPQRPYPLRRGRTLLSCFVHASSKQRLREIPAYGKMGASQHIHCRGAAALLGGPFMKATTLVVLAGALLVPGTGIYAQGGAQASSSASSSTSVQADKSGAKASSNTAAASSAQAGKSSAALSSGTTTNAALSQPVDARKTSPAIK